MEAKNISFHLHLMTIFSSLKSILTTAPRLEERWSRSEDLGFQPLMLNQVQSIASLAITRFSLGFYFFTVECAGPHFQFPKCSKCECYIGGVVMEVG